MNIHDKVKLTRVWHANTSKAGRVDELSPNIKVKDALSKIVDEYESQWDEGFVRGRMANESTIEKGTMYIDMVDCTYQLKLN